MNAKRFAIGFVILWAVGLTLCWLLPHNQSQIAQQNRTESVTVDRIYEVGDAAPAVAKHFGYEPNREEARAFLRSLPQPLLRDAGADLFRDGEDTRPVLLYRALQAVHREKTGTDWVVESQGIGDCVSWGWKHGIDVHQAVLYKLGLVSDWKPIATEPIYGGSRVEARGVTFGGWSDGSYGAAAAKWCRDWGALFRQPYDSIDLTRYSANRAKEWGAYGCGGRDDRGRLDSIAKQHPVKTVALVTTFREAAAAIRSGYPVAVCSMQGFASERDKDGFAPARGTWAHCMVFVGVRFDAKNGLLCLNSWGPAWIRGPKWPEDQPDGSFWVESHIADRMLAGEDSYAISGFVGFPPRKIDHSKWVQVKPSSRDRVAAASLENALAL